MKKTLLMISLSAIISQSAPAIANSGLTDQSEIKFEKQTHLTTEFDNRNLTLSTRDALKSDAELEYAISLLKKHPTGIEINHVVDNLNTEGFSSRSLTHLQSKGTNSCLQVETNKALSSCVQLEKQGIVNIPEMWLYQPESLRTAYTLDDVLFAYPPQGEDTEWKEIEAFDRKGNVVYLDPNVEPSVPVVVVETHGSKAFEYKVSQMNKMLQEAGLQSAGPGVARDFSATTEINTRASSTVATTMMTKIRLNDDQEPWIKGAAEIYTITSGVKSANNDAELKIIPLHYLDHDGENYYPNQLVLFWDEYTYNAANIQFWEDDGDTNYKSLVAALISAVEAAGGLAGLPELSAIAKIAGLIVEAMPSNWFSDDDDFVDTCYTITKGRSYTDHLCAAKNARLSLKPYTLSTN